MTYRRLIASPISAIAAIVLLPLLAGCGGLSGDAQAVADACGKLPGTTTESCGCYAKELQSKLKPELMRVARYAQTEPGKLFDPKIIGNLSANDVLSVTRASASALKTCKIVS
jgi:hypothetical protein